VAPPLLKWPGGKRAILRELLTIIPSEYSNYYEPFAGGAALFFGLEPKQAVLSDSNDELINFYVQVRDALPALMPHLQSMTNSETEYYCVRESHPLDSISRAARFYYLTLLSFNGIYRVNLKGEFNVPYGQKTHLAIYNEFKFASASRALQSARLEVADFETIARQARESDLVYFDPPYTVAHNSYGFLKYNEKIFSWKDQERLALLARELAAQGVRVVVSNADNEDVRRLYSDFSSYRIERSSVIAANASKRGKIAEQVFIKEG
jgi:DNA adenine methylase